jgi:hypothetical protein
MKRRRKWNNLGRYRQRDEKRDGGDGDRTDHR